jgi:hypothetical protein
MAHAKDDPTPVDVAKWMQQKLAKEKVLYQEDVVYEISDLFGEEFTYDNDSGNLAIGKPVLAAFRKLTGVTVVWDRTDRFWRFREPGDEPGRQQAD